MVLARGPLHLRVSNSMPIPSQAWRECYLIDILIGFPPLLLHLPLSPDRESSLLLKGHVIRLDTPR